MKDQAKPNETYRNRKGLLKATAGCIFFIVVFISSQIVVGAI